MSNILDVYGYQLDNCDCPDACRVYSYGAEMSYAALSSLSVDNMLHSNTTTLEKKYRHALEIRHRVDVTHLEETIFGLRNITTAISNYNWITNNMLG